MRASSTTAQRLELQSDDQKMRSRGYLLIFLLAVLGTLVLFGLLLQQSYRQALTKADADASNLGWVLESQIDTSLRRLDADLQHLVRRVQPSDLVARNAPDLRANWNSYLDSFKISFPEVADFYIIDAKGDALYSSGTFKTFNVSERSHYKRLSTDPTAGLVFTDVVISKSNGRPTIVFARGIRDSTGAFIGLVAALVDLDYFQKIFASIDIGPKGFIALRKTEDNKLVLRQPPKPQDINVGTSTLNFELVQQGEKIGHTEFAVPGEGVTRLTTFRTLERFPFYVITGLAKDDILAGWRIELLAAGIIVTVLLSLLGYALWHLWLAQEQRARTMQDLVLALDEAEVASLSKGQFLANMSHEIRTPMNAILGLLNLLQSTDLSTRQRDYADKTEAAAQSLLGLLNDILDFSKVEAGKMTVEVVPMYMSHLLHNLSVVLSANVGPKDIEVLFDIDERIPHVVQGDAMRLQQVLINLGGNAIKFTSQGQVVVGMKVADTTPTTVTIVFSVQDSGIGIAPENQSKIFTGFSQAESSTTRRFGGTGLGLAISKRFVELMGGELVLKSALGEGSTFSFSLCMPLADPAVDGPDTMPLRPSVPPQKVLVIDDNAIAARLNQRMVQSWGWSATIAHTGTQALDIIRTEHAVSTAATFPFSVIYVDWQMDILDGWETSRRIRELASQWGVPQPLIIMITAHGRETLAMRSEAEQSLLNGFLVKPVTASMMLDACMEAMAGKNNLRAITKGRSSKRQLLGMRILVVEDNLINQQVAEELLSGEGAIVSMAANGRLGVDAVAAAAPQFDAVLMDLQMPEMDGYEATRVIREELLLDKLPIIAMTANAMTSDREACLQAGMNEHIGKPFDMGKLVSLLIRMTGLHPPQSETAASQNTNADGSEPLPVIKGVDLVGAIGRMSGLRALYVRTARDFCTQLDGNVQEMAARLVGGDHEHGLRLLHTLKGHAATLGIQDLSAQAAALEVRIKSGAGIEDCAHEWKVLQGLVEPVKGRIQKAIDALSSAAEEPSPVTSRSYDHAEVAAALEEIATLTAASDLGALIRLAELQGPLSALPGDFYTQLGDKLQGLDMDGAHAVCQSLLGSLPTPPPRP